MPLAPFIEILIVLLILSLFLFLASQFITEPFLLKILRTVVVVVGTLALIYFLWSFAAYTLPLPPLKR